jgi:uncharacterized surface protein with fasciclin (FAS1) repeats
MKINLLLKIFSLSLIIILSSCDYSDDAGQPIDPTPSTFEIIANSEDHNILEQILIETGLDDILNSGTYTIFAPDDEAFQAIDTSDLSDDEVVNILLNHVITGNASSTDFGNGYIKTNATESFSGDNNFIDLYVNVDSDLTLNGSANVTVSDNEANNGTVHVVDAVIMLADVETLTKFNPNFSNLAAALDQQNLLSTLSTNFNTSPAPFTVFGPNNTAFENFIAEDNGFETIEQILDYANLTDVLTYHVLPEAGVRENNISDGISPMTIQGETFTINTTNGVVITDQNERLTNVTTTNITASNGVIHVIDNVLLPTLP